MRVISTSTGINGTGPSYLFSENGDLSFLLFFETVLSRELSGKVSKNFIDNFNF